MAGMREEQEISVLGRLCSLEVMILFMGCVTAVYGVVTGNWGKALIGLLVVAGAVALLQISRFWCRDVSKEKKQE